MERKGSNAVKTFDRSFPDGKVSPAVIATAVLLAAIVLAWSTAAHAHEPRVEFDVEYSIECHDVTPESHAEVYPDEMIIQLTLSAAVWVVEGREDDLRQLTFAITSPGRRMRVADFQPRTELESDTSGEISVVRSSESIRSLGATLGANFAAPHGIVSAHATPSGNASTTARDEVKESSQKIPNRSAVLISGTIEGGHGVLFKFKPSVRNALEGTKQFTCQFIVPRQWRGDWIHVACGATAIDRQVVFEKLIDAGRADFAVALYLAGDRPAKQAALSLARAQGDHRAALREASATHPRGVYRLAQLMDDARLRVEDTSVRWVPESVKETARHWGLIDDVIAERPVSLTPEERLLSARATLREFADDGVSEVEFGAK